MTPIQSLVTRTCTAALIACCATSASAEDTWPVRPIRVVVPYTPGGPSDIVLRIAADKMQTVLKQPIILDNRPGAGGNIGAAEAARSAPDGYTWFWTTDTVLTVNPHVYKRLGFDTAALVPVAIGSSFNQTLVCNPEAGIKTLAELVAKAKATEMSYASGGTGVPGHLAMELLMATAGINMQHVPYKGPAPATQEVIAGFVPCGFLAGPTVLPFVRSGRLVALAVSGAHRSPVLTDVPTVAESGYPGFDASFFLVMLAPRGVPPAIVDRFQRVLVDALRSPEVAERIRPTDQEVVASTPAEAVRMLSDTSKKWSAVAERIHLHLD